MENKRESNAVHRVREDDVEATDVPGRKLRWLFAPEDRIAHHCSMNVVEIGAGETVRPAHAHPDAEEVIYAVSGSGKVWVDGAVEELPQGSAVLFPAGAVHMVRNPGTETLKLVCFFAPPVDFGGYEFYEEVTFPD